VFQLLRFLLPAQLLQPVMKPLARLLMGLIAIPLFRLFLHRVARQKELDRELEKDLEEWFRGSILLLIASRNMEEYFFGWVQFQLVEEHWFLLGGRLMLALGVIEGMPDQALFGIIHPGPPKLKLERGRVIGGLLGYVGPLIRGLACKYLNRTSPVYAIMSAFLPDRMGWICFSLAITQYLIIGLVTSRDRAANVLQQFDSAVAERREELRSALDAEERG